MPRLHIKADAAPLSVPVLESSWDTCTHAERPAIHRYPWVESKLPRRSYRDAHQCAKLQSSGDEENTKALLELFLQRQQQGFPQNCFISLAYFAQSECMSNGRYSSSFFFEFSIGTKTNQNRRVARVACK